MLVISSLGAGGAERVITELAAFLAVKGYPVTLVTLEGDRADHYSLSPDVRRVRMDIMWESSGFFASIAGMLRRLRMIRRMVRAAGADVVISFVDMTNIRVLLALAGTRIPVIVSERTDPRRHSIGSVWTRLRRYCYPLAARVVVQTEGVAAWARTWLPARKVAIVPNAVRRPSDVADNRPAGLPHGNILMGMGRLSVEKGFDRLLQAYHDSGLHEKGWFLVILGEGPERYNLSGLAERLGIVDRFLLPGLQVNPDAWLKHADIFALSSRYEGFPNVLIEAMQCARACVAFACDSGPADLVRHGHDGWLVPADDTAAFADALRVLTDNPALRIALGEAATDISNRLTGDTVYGQWQSICDQVAAQDGKEHVRFKRAGAGE
ncbi:glycosyltransferase [Paraburkholderia solisilvae]|nr:glycosyltransferase [Paraburkholderia solisilvae]